MTEIRAIDIVLTPTPHLQKHTLSKFDTELDAGKGAEVFRESKRCVRFVPAPNSIDLVGGESRASDDRDLEKRRFVSWLFRTLSIVQIAQRD